MEMIAIRTLSAFCVGALACSNLLAQPVTTAKDQAQQLCFENRMKSCGVQFDGCMMSGSASADHGASICRPQMAQCRAQAENYCFERIGKVGGGSGSSGSGSGGAGGIPNVTSRAIWLANRTSSEVSFDVFWTSNPNASAATYQHGEFTLAPNTKGLATNSSGSIIVPVGTKVFWVAYTTGQPRRTWHQSYNDFHDNHDWQTAAVISGIYGLTGDLAYSIPTSVQPGSAGYVSLIAQ